MGQSFSGIRKLLEEDLLCEKLRGRVQYFFTIYHNAPDQYGRFAVRVDGTEIFRANPYNEAVYDQYQREMKAAKNIPARRWNGKEILFEKENQLVEKEAAKKAVREGYADTYDVFRAIDLYRNQKAEQSLSSDNLLLRMFAVLDRRIGKRTLVKLTDVYEYLPYWLKQFYALRFAVEEISVNNRSELLLSADSEIGLYHADDDIICNFEELLRSFSPSEGYTEQDFVVYLKKKLGENAIWFVKNLECSSVENYRNVKRFNF